MMAVFSGCLRADRRGISARLWLRARAMTAARSSECMVGRVDRPPAAAVVRLPLSRQGGRGGGGDPSILETMTATTESSSLADRAPDPDVLRAHLLEADPGVLVAVLAQMTGDPAVIDRYASKIDHVPDPPERAGTTDTQTAALLADEIVAALGRPRPVGALAVADRDFFVCLLPVAL